MRPTASYLQHNYQCRRAHITSSYHWTDSAPKHVKCGEKRCKAKAWLVSIRRTHNSSAPPTFYFQDPKSGRIYTPAGPPGPKMTKKLSSEGYVRKEITSDRDYAKFRRDFTLQLTRQHDEAAQAEQDFADQFWKPIREENRRKLIEQMKGFTKEGREFAEAAMARNDAADRAEYDRRKKSFDPGFHIESREMDANHRLPHNDERTNWENQW